MGSTCNAWPPRPRARLPRTCSRKQSTRSNRLPLTAYQPLFGASARETGDGESSSSGAHFAAAFGASGFAGIEVDEVVHRQIADEQAVGCEGQALAVVGEQRREQRPHSPRPRPLPASRSLIGSPGMEAGGSGGCHHYFPYPPWLSYAALLCPHGIDGAARGRKIDIYFLLIKIQARLKILCIRIAPPHGAAGAQLKEADAAKRFRKALFRFATPATP
jgi:hypothetical protein